MRRVAVLMYHRLGAGAIAGREIGEEIYAVTPSLFEAHLETVASVGVPVLGFEDLLGALSSAQSREGGVAITFDDGNATDHTVALPALNRRGWSAISFVVPAWLGQPGYLDWQQVRELKAGGMTVGAHGFDHTLLGTLDEDGIRAQLRKAADALEAGLGERPRSISLPGGSGGERAVRIAQEEGFELVATSVPRVAQPARGLAPTPRFAIRRDDSPVVVRALALQHRGALLRFLLRYALLAVLRGALGERLYGRIRSRSTGGEIE